MPMSFYQIDRDELIQWRYMCKRHLSWDVARLQCDNFNVKWEIPDETMDITLKT